MQKGCNNNDEKKLSVQTAKTMVDLHSVDGIEAEISRDAAFCSDIGKICMPTSEDEWSFYLAVSEQTSKHLIPVIVSMVLEYARIRVPARISFSWDRNCPRERLHVIDTVVVNESGPTEHSVPFARELKPFGRIDAFTLTNGLYRRVSILHSWWKEELEIGISKPYKELSQLLASDRLESDRFRFEQDASLDPPFYLLAIRSDLFVLVSGNGYLTPITAHQDGNGYISFQVHYHLSVCIPMKPFNIVLGEDGLVYTPGFRCIQAYDFAKCLSTGIIKPTSVHHIDLHIDLPAPLSDWNSWWFPYVPVDDDNNCRNLAQRFNLYIGCSEFFIVPIEPYPMDMPASLKAARIHAIRNSYRLSTPKTSPESKKRKCPTTEKDSNEGKDEQKKKQTRVPVAATDSKRCTLDANWLEDTAAKTLFNQAKTYVLEEYYKDKKQPTTTMYGKKEWKEPRVVAWCAKEPRDSVFQYSRLKYEALKNNPWPDFIALLEKQIHTKTGQHFNVCLINFYEKSQDYVSPHQDLDSLDTYVASVSAYPDSKGYRRFEWMTDRNAKVSDRSACNLGQGSLFIMLPGFNRDYFHALPKSKPKDYPNMSKTQIQAMLDLPRINITFRQHGNKGKKKSWSGKRYKPKKLNRQRSLHLLDTKKSTEPTTTNVLGMDLFNWQFDAQTTTLLIEYCPFLLWFWVVRDSLPSRMIIHYMSHIFSQRLAKEFDLDPTQINVLMNTPGIFIGGSFMLQCILGEIWSDSDLDIFTHKVRVRIESYVDTSKTFNPEEGTHAHTLAYYRDYELNHVSRSKRAEREKIIHGFLTENENRFPNHGLIRQWVADVCDDSALRNLNGCPCCIRGPMTRVQDTDILLQLNQYHLHFTDSIQLEYTNANISYLREFIHPTTQRKIQFIKIRTSLRSIQPVMQNRNNFSFLRNYFSCGTFYPEDGTALESALLKQQRFRLHKYMLQENQIRHQKYLARGFKF